MTPDTSTAIGIIARALNRPVSDIGRDAEMGKTPGWDSLGHMRILLEAERTLGHELAADIAVEIVDLASLENALKRAQGNR